MTMPNREYQPTTLEELAHVRQTIAEVGDAIEELANANHKRTSRQIRFLAGASCALAVAVCALLIMTKRNGDALREANSTVRSAQECIDPAGKCYQDVERSVDENIDRAVKQLECDLRYYCVEGYWPQIPPPPGYAP